MGGSLGRAGPARRAGLVGNICPLSGSKPVKGSFLIGFKGIFANGIIVA
jgi:hypothetical protein